MKLLEDIPSFPETARKTLESAYGISSAEAFYDHAVKNPEGMRMALRASSDELNHLVRLAESYLSPEFVAACRQPVIKHPRGLAVDERRPS